MAGGCFGLDTCCSRLQFCLPPHFYCKAPRNASLAIASRKASDPIA